MPRKDKSKNYVSARTFAFMAAENYVFETDDRLFQQQLDFLIDENNSLIGKHASGFVFKNIFLHKSTAPKGIIAGVHLNLFEDVQDWHQRNEEFKANKQTILQGLGTLVPPDAHYQEIRDSFPEFLIPCHPSLHGLERTRPEAFYLQKNAMLLDQWYKTRELIEYYVSSRLLY